MFPARRWVFLSFLLSFAATSLLFSTQKVSAEWSFDNEGPTVTTTVACDSQGRKIGETGTTYTCLGDSATITIECTDNVTGCKSTTYDVGGTAGSFAGSMANLTRTRAQSGTTVSVTGSKDNAGNNALSLPSNITLSFATCTIDSVTLGQDSIRETGTTTATATTTGTITKVVFTPTDTNVASANPSEDSISPYGTYITGVGQGTARIHATGYVGTSARCDNFGGISGSGVDNSPQITVTPACTISFVSTSIIVDKGDTGTAIAQTNNIVDSVDFNSLNTTVATVNPASQTAYSGTGPYTYNTNVNALSAGTSDLTASGMIGGVARCSASGADKATISVNNAGAWWQVMDMDVYTGGNLTSNIPAGCILPGCNPLFNLNYGGGYPGVNVYGGSYEFNRGTAGSPAWLVRASYSGNRYNYDWFARLAPAGTFTDNNAKIDSSSVGGNTLTGGGYNQNGVIWKSRDGDLNINGGTANIGNDKVVLFVDGNLTISNNGINLNKGSGFFAAIVSGDIYIDSSVTQSGTGYALEGLYIANGIVRTETNGATDSKLRVRGSVVGLGGVVLQRNLVSGNDTSPAEYFEYAPDLIFTMPKEISRRGVIQREIAP